MNTLKMHYMWLGLGLILSLLITMIIQCYRRTVMHYRYVHITLYMDALSKVLPNFIVQSRGCKSTHIINLSRSTDTLLKKDWLK